MLNHLSNPKVDVTAGVVNSWTFNLSIKFVIGIMLFFHVGTVWMAVPPGSKSSLATPGTRLSFSSITVTCVAAPEDVLKCLLSFMAVILQLKCECPDAALFLMSNPPTRLVQQSDRFVLGDNSCLEQFEVLFSTGTRLTRKLLLKNLRKYIWSRNFFLDLAFNNNFVLDSFLFNLHDCRLKAVKEN